MWSTNVGASEWANQWTLEHIVSFISLSTERNPRKRARPCDQPAAEDLRHGHSLAAWATRDSDVWTQTTEAEQVF